MEKSTLAKRDVKPPNAFSSNATQPSDSAADQQFLVSFGVVISCRLGDVEHIRSLINGIGGRVVFQTVSNGPLFLFRAAQVERALTGDVSALAEIHNKKTRRVKN
ncbi:MAG: hypothetical protein ABSE39_04685 [Candidatus Bathyarchaeia archaeon]|jgi:hypothetical protein